MPRPVRACRRPARPPLLTVDLDGGGTDDVLDMLPEEPLTEAEAGYARAARAARAANTLRGYRSDWAEFVAWCRAHALQPLPATPATPDRLPDRAARRLSSIRFAHAAHDLPDPTAAARVRAVWEGIRRLHGAPPEQAKPLMPPELFDVLDACPVTRTWKTRGRAPEPDLGGARDRALVLVGFVGALRRSELAVLDVDDVAEHANGLVLTLNRSKTNQTGEQAELVVLPRAGNPDRCPVTVL